MADPFTPGRLIAAAPDLLRTLRELADVCGEMPDGDGVTHDDDPGRPCSPDSPGSCALCKARAVIATIEGV